MDNKLIDSIKKNLESKTTDELLEIWIENDRVEWSDEAFQAIKQILNKRDQVLPKQNPVRESEEFHSGKGLKIWGIVLISIGIILTIGLVLLYIYTIPQITRLNDHKEKRINFLKEIGVLKESDEYTPILALRLSRKKRDMEQIAKEGWNKNDYQIAYKLGQAVSKNFNYLKRLNELNKELKEINISVRQKWEEKPKYFYMVFLVVSHLTAKRYPDEISSVKDYMRGFLVVIILFGLGTFLLIRGKNIEKNLSLYLF